MEEFAWKSRLGAVLCCLILVPDLFAQTSPSGTSLGDMSIEDLLNIQVTTVSKTEENLRDTASAVSVLSNDDLRRAGATSLPDALRLVAGMDVGVVNSREWAVSARGFNFVFASKLLVLIDGRSVYTPFFAGVRWDLTQVTLEDVDRIEVIRGPGAAVWGANAVNGVINVVTRSARDTQGGFVSGGVGDILQGTAEARYGGRINGTTTYRVFGSLQSQDGFTLASGAPANDGWSRRYGGGRLDRYSTDARTHLTWQADATAVTTDARDYDAYSVNSIGRWSRRNSARSSVEVQGYYDRVYANEATRSRNSIDTFDLTAQQTRGLGARNDAVWGLGYRFIKSRFSQTNSGVRIRNPKVNLRLFSAFVENKFTLVPNAVTLTAGVRLEHNDFTGVEVQPTVRAVFKPSRQQTVWTAISRAVRTPSEIQDKDVNGIVVGPPFVGPDGGRYLPTITGNGEPDAEVERAYEAGYRVQPTARVSVDLALFHNEYSDLITTGGVTRFIPGAPVGTAEIPFRNLLNATTNGLGATLATAPTKASRVTLLYALVSQKVRGPAEASRSGTIAPPRHQVSLRTGYDFTHNLSMDGQLRYVGKIQDVSDYLTADLHVLFRPVDRFELAFGAQDLLDSRHLEQGPAPITVTSEAPRKVYGKLTWRF